MDFAVSEKKKTGPCRSCSSRGTRPTALFPRPQETEDTVFELLVITGGIDMRKKRAGFYAAFEEAEIKITRENA